MAKVGAALFAVWVGLAVAACGASSGNGEAAKSASQILTDAATCLRHARSVQIEGTATSSGQTVAFNETVASTGAGSGYFSVAGAQIQVVAASGRLYINADAALWEVIGATATESSALANKWVTAPASLASQLQSVAGFSQLATYLSSAAGHISNAGNAVTPDGRQSVRLNAGGNAVYVSASGPACPLYLHVGVNTASPADIALSNFNANVAVTPPPNPVDGTGVLGG
jgi:hypothetical protein